MNILLIEDHESIINGLKYAFNVNNYNLIAKTTIKESIEYLENNKPEIIILDVSLPDGNGFDLYELAVRQETLENYYMNLLLSADD